MIEEWRRHCNSVRPHSSLNNMTPEHFSRPYGINMNHGEPSKIEWSKFSRQVSISSSLNGLHICIQLSDNRCVENGLRNWRCHIIFLSTEVNWASSHARSQLSWMAAVTSSIILSASISESKKDTLPPGKFSAGCTGYCQQSAWPALLHCQHDFEGKCRRPGSDSAHGHPKKRRGSGHDRLCCRTEH